MKKNRLKIFTETPTPSFLLLHTPNSQTLPHPHLPSLLSFPSLNRSPSLPPDLWGSSSRSPALFWERTDHLLLASSSLLSPERGHCRVPYLWAPSVPKEALAAVPHTLISPWALPWANAVLEDSYLIPSGACCPCAFTNGGCLEGTPQTGTCRGRLPSTSTRMKSRAAALLTFNTPWKEFRVADRLEALCALRNLAEQVFR